MNVEVESIVSNNNDRKWHVLVFKMESVVRFIMA